VKLGKIVKSDDDVLDYDTDFSDWLPSGDDIATAVATITGTTIVVDSVANTTDTVKVWLSGGVDGDSETLTVTATTTGGRTKEVCYSVRVKGC